MTNLQASAFWITGPRRGELRSNNLPNGDEKTVQIRTLYSAVSRGTEALVFGGDVPPSEYQRMRAPFQEGDFPAPVKYGYINVGVVEQGPNALMGQQVFCLYPHQTHYIVPIDAVTPLPNNVPAERAILAANLETAINGLWDAGPAIGDHISIVGAGAVGCLVAWLAGRIPGCAVELVDTNPDRQKVANALGVEFALPDAARRDADLVVHATGSSDGLTTALQLAGFEATVLELSWYGKHSVNVPLGGAFHSQRLTLRGSQVGHIANRQRARWTYQRRLKLALELLSESALDCLITGESRFNELPTVMAELVDNPRASICHRIAYA